MSLQVVGAGDHSLVKQLQTGIDNVKLSSEWTKLEPRRGFNEYDTHIIQSEESSSLGLIWLHEVGHNIMALSETTVSQKEKKVKMKLFNSILDETKNSYEVYLLGTM